MLTETHTLHAMWNAVAPAWGEYARLSDHRAQHITDAMLDRAQIGPGDRVLELACGAGGAGLAAARRVAPGGSVVLSDVAPGMTAIAGLRAAETRQHHLISAQTLDMENIAAADDTFDAVLCREGLMLTPDPARAVAEIRRVLRPGGRAVVTVWGPRAANPWLGVLFDAVSAELGVPVPPPGLPGPFSLGDREVLANVLDADVDALPAPFVATSPAVWWQQISALAGPLASMLAALPQERSDAIRTTACERIATYATTSGVLEIPGVCLIGG